MSVTSLSASFAHLYAPRREPVGPSDQQIAALHAEHRVAFLTPPPSPTPTTATGLGSALNSLAAYIPGDVLTFYLGASAAIASAAQASDAKATLPEPYLSYSRVAFFTCLFAAPIWAVISVALTLPRGTKPPWQAWVWPAVSGTIAFAAYAFAVPATFLSSDKVSLFATLAVLGVTPLLAIGGRLWVWLVPPPSDS